jgi:hypothetical protein
VCFLLVVYFVLGSRMQTQDSWLTMGKHGSHEVHAFTEVEADLKTFNSSVDWENRVAECGMGAQHLSNGSLRDDILHLLHQRITG